MDKLTTPPTRPGHHPLLLAAAVAVVLFCLVGVAAILGWIPNKLGHKDDAALNNQVATTQAYDSTPSQYGANGTAGSTYAGNADVPNVPPSEAVGTPPASAQYAPAPAPAYPAPRAATHPRAAAVTHHDTQVARNETTDSSRWCSNCGNIESIREVAVRAPGSGLGAAGGAVLGGLLGRQVGSGHGQQLATVAGAVGGAVIGNQVEGNMKSTKTYEIRVRMDDGSLRVFNQHAAPGWRNGERVKIVNGSIHTV
jgi:outer membrane lipoprotein SlyB